MKHVLYPALVLLLAAFVLSSCGPDSEDCPGLREERYYLVDEEKHLHPYTGYDTLKFKHSNGNIYTFYGQGIDSGFSVRSSSVSPDCPDHILTYRQFYKINFISENYEQITLSKLLTSLSNSNGEGEIHVGIDSKSYIINTSFYKSNTNNITLFDSLAINGKTYKRVAKMFYNGYWDNPLFTYFNMEHGILKIVVNPSKNEILERVPD